MERIPNPRFRFIGNTPEALCQRIVKAFIGERVSAPQDFSALVEADKMRQVLEREISALRNKVKNEKQFNKKVAHKKLQVLNAQPQDLTSGSSRAGAKIPPEAGPQK